MSSLTASYAQTGDSITCYNNSELKRIASRVVYANECDSLLGLSELQLSYKDSVITNLQRALTIKDNALDQGELRAELCDELLIDYETTIKKTIRKLKWTRFGWVATSAGLFVLWLSALF